MATPCCQTLDDKLKLVIRALKILTQSSATKESLLNGTSEHLVENVLHQNLISLESWLCEHKSLQMPDVLTCLRRDGTLRSCNSINIRKQFSDCMISILDFLVNLLNSDNTLAKDKEREIGQDESSCPILSLQQEKQISSCVQFVVVLGLSPYLPQGVGIPISQRLGPGQILLASTENNLTMMNELSRIECLMPVLKLFIKMSSCAALHDMVEKNYLSDILVVLIQVRYSARSLLQNLKNQDPPNVGFIPTLKDKKSSNAEPRKDTYQEPVTNEKTTFDDLEQTVQECNKELDAVIRTSSLSSVMKEVLFLLGFAKSSQGVKCIPWFRRVMASILRDIIMTPRGIQHLMAAFLGDLSTYDTKDWQSCQAIAKIIAFCPVNNKNVEPFYSSVSQQLLELLRPGQTSIPVGGAKTVGMAVVQLNRLQPDLMDRVFFNPLLTPLRSCTPFHAFKSATAPDLVVVPEKSLTPCILQCHGLFVIGQETPSALCSKLEPVLPVLFALHMHLYQTASHLKNKVKDLLAGYLHHAETQDGVTSLIDLLLSSSKAEKSHQRFHPDFTFVSGPEGGVEVVFNKHKVYSMDTWTHPVDAVVDVLKCVKSEALNSELFLVLLQRLTSMLSTEASATSDILLPVRMMSEAVQDVKLEELREKVLLVSLISAVGEEFGSSMIHNTSQILIFTKVTLERYVCTCQSCQDFEWETLGMALGLLSVVLGFGWMLTDEDKKVLDSILPLLNTLSQMECVSPHIKDMASDLKVSVATRGLVSLNLSGQSSNPGSYKGGEKDHGQKTGRGSQKPSPKPLIEVLSSKEVDEAKSKSERAQHATPLDEFSSKTASCEKRQEDGDTWSAAMQEARDALIPVRGHGLIQLARMVEDRWEGVAHHQRDLLQTFMENLMHEDSYIYLASINGLASLSDVCSEEVVPALTSEFMSRCQDAQSSWETTLKVGEAVVKATRRLGEVAPKYRDTLLSAMLCGARHDNSLVRASCLSGLAEVCQLLRYSLSPVLHEVLMCCHKVMTSDPEPDPRRAAVFTLASLLRGLGKDTLTVMSEGLSELYNALKSALHRDPDEKVKVHAQLALQELDEIMRGVLFPSQNLTKSIKILDYK